MPPASNAIANIALRFLLFLPVRNVSVPAMFSSSCSSTAPCCAENGFATRQSVARFAEEKKRGSDKNVGLTGQWAVTPRGKATSTVTSLSIVTVMLQSVQPPPTLQPAPLSTTTQRGKSAVNPLTFA
jgi:hypothetical protein